MNELLAIVRHLTSPESGECALATLVSVDGSTYRRPGARLLLLPSGERIGSISGGCLEEDVIERARRVLATGVADTIVYDTTSENDLVWGVGLGCHGVARVLVEKLPARPAWAATLAANFAARRPTELHVVHRAENGAALGTRLEPEPVDAPAEGVFKNWIQPPTALAIYGAGDDAQPLARLAQGLGWTVIVADVRPAFVTAMRFPGTKLVVGPAAELVARTAPDADMLAVVMTHHYIHDVPILRELLARPLAYLGLLGPRKRAEKILSDLAAAGVAITPEVRARLHAPVGLDLGADTPEEVALAIVAEMRATLAQRDARPLRNRTTPIHA